MTTLGSIPKPESAQYRGKRKLFLVPLLMLPPDLPDDGPMLVDRYWSEVRDQVDNLARSLGTVTHVFHEALYDDSEEGLKMIEAMNPKGYSFINALCQSTATLEATEDRALVEESSDWQRCLNMGLTSEKVRTLAMESYQETAGKRNDHIAGRLDERIGEDETGLLFIREDHRVQFPSSIQVFYVAPPGLDAIKRWMDDLMSAMTRDMAAQATAPAEAPEADPADEAPGPE